MNFLSFSSFAVQLLRLQLYISQLLRAQPYFLGFFSVLPIHLGDHEFLPSPEDTSRPMVTIQDGILSGFTMKSVGGRNLSAFQSIPYAEPPVGSLRFRNPVKNKPWNGTRKAVLRSPQCIQLDMVQLLRIHGQEDCLYLNVYVPTRSLNETASLPVMVWIHGGFFYFGAGSLYGPLYLLDHHDVILVTLNYRLGPFGFLSTGDNSSPGNQGLKDQLLAMKWVRDNIAAFGGDPNSVTLFGESAGAVSVELHIVSPASQGLFHRAIAQSGSAFCPMAKIPNVPEIAKDVGKLHDCPVNSTMEMVECLRKVSSWTLALAQLRLAKWLIFPMLWFGPTVEHDHPDAFITKTPEQYYKDGLAANVPLISGLTSDELSLFVAVIARAPILFSQFNRQWSWVGQNILEFGGSHRNLEEETENEERVKKIWDFYMGSGRLNWGSRHNLSKMLSDRHFTECTLTGMRYHSKYTNQSVYGYRFSYQGRYGIVQQVGASPENWGVAHADDLIYLLNNPNYYSTLKPDTPEMEMSNTVTSYWTSFARDGKPCNIYPGNDYCKSWLPIEPANDTSSPLRFLDFELKPKMISDPYVDRYKFWRSLNT